MPSGLKLTLFDLAQAGDNDYAALNRHFNRYYAEARPDDLPESFERTSGMLRNLPPTRAVTAWVARDVHGDEIRASAMARIDHDGANAHVAQFDIRVESADRRQGIGREMLRRIVAVAQHENRTLLVTYATNRIPASARFLERLGAERGLELCASQLRLADIDSQALQTRLELLQASNSGLTLGLWKGTYPDHSLIEIAHLNEIINTSPRGSLQMEDVRFTPDSLREIEAMLFASGQRRWSLYCAESVTNRFAGITEIIWSPDSPTIIHQGFTGVFPQFRGHGIGLWMKSALLAQILQALPGAHFIRTGNADSNTPMLAINQALGFRPYSANAVWQLQTARAQTYLNSSSA